MAGRIAVREASVSRDGAIDVSRVDADNLIWV
jgi:hypothetical protein